MEYDYDFNADGNSTQPVDLSTQIQLNEKLLTFRCPPVLTVCGNIVHLNMYLNKKNELDCIFAASFPECYAPLQTHYVNVSVMGGGNYLAEIRPNGSIKFNCCTGAKNNLIVLDATWIL